MTQRKRVGLALGGGVVRGNAHVGVLLALEEAGVRVDYISGTSAGAIVAACYAAGMSPQALRAFSARLAWLRLLRPVWPKRGLFSFRGLTGLLTRHLGDLRFEDLHIPCAIAVTDVENGAARYISSGRLFPVVQASCSVPGAIAPVALEDCLAGEGGITNMLPAAVLRRMGAEYVIGVDVFQPRLWRWLGPLGYLLAAAETALEHTGGGVDQVDCLIRPRLAGRSYLLFSRRQIFYKLGLAAAQEKMPEILLALGRSDGEQA